MNRRSLRIFIDSIFPPTPHERVLRDYNVDRFSQHLHPLPVGNIITLSQYHIPAIQAAVTACKFERNRRAATLLASLLAGWLIDNSVRGATILIPIPLSTKREKERGFNQVVRVLTHIPTSTSVSIAKNVLIRSLNTQRQTSLGRNDRLKNITGAFAMHPQWSHHDWSHVMRVIICDDVTTTGTTLHEAEAVLRSHLPAHITIICLAFAH